MASLTWASDILSTQVQFPLQDTTSSGNFDSCDIFHKAKNTYGSFTIRNNEFPFDLIHCVLWGKYHTASLDRSNYILWIVDKFSRATWIYLLKNKSDTRVIFFVKFHATIQTHLRKIPLRSDHGMEFTSLRSFFDEHRILHEISCTATPNKILESHKNRHILNVAMSLRFLGKSFHQVLGKMFSNCRSFDQLDSKWSFALVKPHMKSCFDKFRCIHTLEFLVLFVMLEIIHLHKINLIAIP